MDSPLEPTKLPGRENGVPVPETQDLSGQTLGDFRVLRRLGQGGMGQVYLAEQLSLRRKVALKIMRPEVAASPTALERFRREAEAVARVNHANIVQVYFTGVADGLHFMALEYVEGRNLREFLAKKGPPELLLALNIMRQVATALERAHEAGIIHRDIKPENILLTKQGEAKVADFGLSRCLGGDRQALNLTQTGVSMGTPLYMSPEQVQSKEVDARTDIYSLGVTCYHMLAGEPPFRGQSPFDVAIQHVQGQATPLQQLRPDLPAELCQCVHKMMARQPDERWASSRDLLAELVRLRQALGGATNLKTQGFDLDGPGSIGGLTTLLPPAPAAKRARFNLRALRPIGLSLLFLGVLALGAGLGWRSARAAKAVPPVGLAPGTAAVRLTSSAGDREATLEAQFKKSFNPANPEEARRHFEATVQLGLLYLDQRRLSAAETFFKQLQAKPLQDIRGYSALGRIGHAAVLAFQDKPDESNQLFLELEKSKPPQFDKTRPPGDWRPWLGKGGRDVPAEGYLLLQPAIRRVVAEALQQNAGNMGDVPLPEALERLRKPQQPRWFGGPVPHEPARAVGKE